MERKRFSGAARFDVAHPKALAIYCSDGRFTESVEELLRSLGEPRLDTLTIPGGPGLLNVWSTSCSSRQAMLEAATFLIAQHKIRRVVLIAHEGCGYYRKLLSGSSAEEIVKRQIEDLNVAARTLSSSGLSIELYYASPRGEHVTFTAVPVGVRVA